MERYYLASLTNNNGELEIKAGCQMSQHEYIKLFELFNFTGFYEICRSIKNMTLESADDLEQYLHTLYHSDLPCDDSKIAKHLTTGNKLLINFLSFIRTFYDVINHAISQKSASDAKEFEALNHALYDDFFGYRFFSRMRNYVIHYNMPLTTIVNSESGIVMYCNRSQLLQYGKWSTVKKEIEHLPEKIDIVPYIAEAKIAITTLYLKSLETIVIPAFEANQKISEIRQINNISTPIILIIHEGKNEPTIKTLPLQLLGDFFEDLKYHPNYGIKIIPAE